MMEHRDEPQVKPLFELAFEKRPAEELYDLSKDPHQLHNVAADPAYAGCEEKARILAHGGVESHGRPACLGGGDAFDSYPYYGGRRPKKQ